LNALNRLTATDQRWKRKAILYLFANYCINQSTN